MGIAAKVVSKQVRDGKSSEKGKPSERVGRKVTGLRPLEAVMAAGLPGGFSISRVLQSTRLRKLWRCCDVRVF
jgi:hypothetical protein